DPNLPPGGEDKLLSLVLTGQMSRAKGAKVFQLEAPKPVLVRVFPRKESLIKRAGDLLTGLSGIWAAGGVAAAAIAGLFAWLRRERSKGVPFLSPDRLNASPPSASMPTTKPAKQMIEDIADYVRPPPDILIVLTERAVSTPNWSAATSLMNTE